jgi:anti-anti-sigma factor
VLKVSVNQVGNATILKCEGRLVRGEEIRLLCTAVRNGQEAIIDFAGVETIDAAGVGLLVSLQAAGIYVTLLNPNETVSHVLRLTGLDSVFEVREGGSVAEVVELANVKSEPVKPLVNRPAALAS